MTDNDDAPAALIAQRRPLLHVPTGKHYVAVFEIGGTVELHPINGPARYARTTDLKNPEIWRKA